MPHIAPKNEVPHAGGRGGSDSSPDQFETRYQNEIQQNISKASYSNSPYDEAFVP
jgi:hypothetical protein